MNRELLTKYEELKSYIASFGSMAVAFSSGVDSTFLLYAAGEALGDRVLAVTATAGSFPKRELKEAVAFCEERGIKHRIVEFDEFAVDGFAKNPPNRCYICKKELFLKFIKAAEAEGISHLCEGSNLDDNGDYRPGLIAVAELKVLSPLRHIGFTKKEIRELSEYFELPTWKKQSFACLASRFPYGDMITKEKLSMVDRGEQLLMDLGFSLFRVRIHGDVARVELLPEEFDRFLQKNIREEIYNKFKEIGFNYVAMDILGYRTGSMNETLREEE